MFTKELKFVHKIRDFSAQGSLGRLCGSQGNGLCCACEVGRISSFFSNAVTITSCRAKGIDKPPGQSLSLIHI